MSMWWLLLVVLAAALYTLNAFVDNYLTDVHSGWRFHPGILLSFMALAGAMIALGLALLGTPLALPHEQILILLLAGASEAVGMIPYFLLLQKQETTDTTILVQMSPLLTLVGSMIILQQFLSGRQLLAFSLICLAVVLIVAPPKRRHWFFRRRHWRKHVLGLAFLTCLSWSLSFVLFAAASDEQNFYPAFFYQQLGLTGAIIFFFAVQKRWRRHLRRYLHSRVLTKVGLNLGNNFLYLSGDLCCRAAFLFAPVAIVSVTVNVLQLFLTFTFGIVFTKIWRHFGREKLNPWLLAQRALAAILTAAGLVLLE